MEMKDWKIFRVTVRKNGLYSTHWNDLALCCQINSMHVIFL